MLGHNHTGQHFLNTIIELQHQEADRLMRYVIGFFFLLGVGFSVPYNTWILSVPLGGLCAIAFFMAQFLSPESNASRWIASAVIPIFTAQFVYQLHGSLDPHVFYFIGTTVLLIYQDWKLYIASTAIFFLHLALFFVLQSTEPIPDYLINAKYLTLNNSFPHFFGGVAHAVLCVWWAKLFQARAQKSANQIGQMEHYVTEVTKQKDLIERANVALDTQLEEKHEKLRDAHDKLRVKDQETDAIRQALKSEITAITQEKDHQINELARIKSVFDPIKEQADRYRNLYDNSSMMMFITNANGIIKEINSSAQITLGYPPTEVIGKSITEWVSIEQLAQQAIAIGNKLQKTLAPTIEVFFASTDEQFWDFKHHNGSSLPIKLNWVALKNDADVTIGYIGLAEVNSYLAEKDRRILQLEQEIAASGAQIRQNIDELASINESFRKSNQQIKQREDFLSTVINNLPVAVYTKNPNDDYKYTLINNKFNEFFNAEGEFVGKTVFDLFAQDLAEKIDADDRKVVTSGQLLTNEVVEINKKQIEFRKVPIFNEQGGVEMLLGIAQDVTDLRNAQQIFETIAESSPIPLVITSLENGTILYINQPLSDVMHYSKADVIGKPSPNYYYKPEVRQQLLELIQKQGYISNFECQFVKKDGTVFWAYLNMRVGYLFDQRCLIGGLIDIDQQKKTQELIRAGQTRLAEILEIAELGSWELDLRSMKMNFDRRHSGWLEGGNKTVAQPITLLFNDFLNRYLGSNEQTAIQNLVEVLVKGEKLTQNRIDYQLTDQAGKVHYLSANLKGIQDHLGKSIRVVATVQDITMRMLFEKTVVESETRLTDAANMAGLSVWELDLVNNNLYLDARYAKILNLSDIKETNLMPAEYFISNHLLPNDAELVSGKFYELGASADESNFLEFEYHVLTTDKLVRDVFTVARVKLEEGKAVKIIGTTQDITEKKTYQEVLKRSEEELKIAQAKVNDALRIASLAVWELDLASVLITFDRLHSQWIGVSIAENETHTEPLLEFAGKYVYPEDIPKIQSELEFAMTRTENASLRTFEYRLHNPELGLRSMLVTGSVIVEEGKATRVIGTTQDITDRRVMEEQLATSQRRFEAMANNVPGIIYQLIIRPDNSRQYTYISPAVKTIIGLAPEDIIRDHNTLDDRVSSDVPIPGYEDVKPLAIQHIPLKFESKVFLDDGTFKWGELNGQLELLENDNLLVNGVIVDITERKLADAEREARQLRVEKQEEAISLLGKSKIIAAGDEVLAFQQIAEISTTALDVALIDIWFFNELQNEATTQIIFDSRIFEFGTKEVRNAVDYPNYFEAVRSGNVLNIQYANYDPRTSELRESVLTVQGINSILIVPIRKRGQQIGFLEFNHSGVAKKFTEDEEGFALSISEIVTLALEAKDRQEALNELRISNATFNSLQTAVPGVVYQFKRENGVPSFPFISEKSEQIFGLPAEVIMKDYHALNSQIHPEDMPSFQQALQTSIQNSSLLNWEGRGIRPDGREIWFQTLGSGEWINENTYIANGLILDITDRKKIEIEKERTQERIIIQDSAIKELTQSEFISEGTVDNHYEMIAQAVVSILKANACFFMFADETYQALTITDSFDNDLMEFLHPNIVVLEKDTPIFFSHILNERSIVLNDVTENEELYLEGKFYFDQFDVKSFLSASIIRNGRISGIIGVEHRQKTRTWQFDEINFLQGVAEIISISLESKARNQTLQALQTKESELTELNQQLSGLVEARTQALSELQTTQQHLVQSEKMASLGQLVAGVAHEINTPISAVKASTRNLFRTLPVVLTEVPTLLRHLSKDDADLFVELVQQSANQNQDLTTQEERQYRMQVKQILDENDIDNSFELAKELVEVRIIDNLERFINLFNHPQSGEIIDKVYKLGQFKKNMENIDLAAEKTARVARALKNYSRVQTSETFTEIFIHESIETILTIYSNQLKYGIAVEKTYEPLMKPVPVFPDEIGQVWTNIINNAIQAMKGKGKLIIDVHTEGENAVVNITDNGPGIPNDIINRIFEPFFTTKPQGEGTGLGLDICRKIVEKHSGVIQVESEPGKTTFIVTLPMKQDQAQVIAISETETTTA